jgi:hypothetical protein
LVLAIISILSRVVDSCSTISLTIWVYFNCLSTFLLYISLSMIFISPYYVPFLYLSAKICFNNLQFNCKKKRLSVQYQNGSRFNGSFGFHRFFHKFVLKHLFTLKTLPGAFKLKNLFFPPHHSRKMSMLVSSVGCCSSTSSYYS